MKLSRAEIKNILDHVRTGRYMTDEVESALYEYFLGNGEMPYGIAKARDGDPYTWISDRLEEMGEDEIVEAFS